MKDISQYWKNIQGTLFPCLEEDIDPFLEGKS